MAGWNTVNVVEVHTPPAIGKVEMQQGIRTKDEAVHWGERNGYSVVYWLKSRQRVYADKLTKNVEALAQKLKVRSERLLKLSQQGGGMADFLLYLAAAVVVYLMIKGGL